MANSSAAEVFSSIGGGVDSLNPFKAGKAAAVEDQARADAAFETAKGLQTKVEQSGSQTNTVKGSNVQTSGTSFAPASAEELALRQSSIDNFQKQSGLVDSFEAGLTGRIGTQDAARDTLGNVLGGNAFDLTQGEQSRIEGLRGADISASSNAVNELLNQRLAETSADAARRGIRGQAFTQLQGDAVKTAAQELNRATLDANRTAAGNAIALPGQRVGIQAGAAGQFADFADAAKQTAIQNRASLQDPVALQQMLDERLRGGTTTSSQTTDQTTTGTNVDSRIGTGEGAANVLAAGIDKPGGTAGGVATTLGALGAVAPIVGSALGKPA